MIKTCILLLLEIFPIIVFFCIGQKVPFLEAIAAYILATMCTIVIILHVSKRVSYLALIFGAVIIGAGSLSIIFNNPDILIIADTIYYFSAAGVLFFLNYKNVNLLKKMFGGIFGVTDTGWDILTRRWVIAFIISGIANEYIRQTGSTDLWLTFQLVRTIGLLLFAAYQFTLTRRYRILDETTTWGIRL